MKVRTPVATLAGNALNWAVGYLIDGGEFCLTRGAEQNQFCPASDWGVGGPIIESEQMQISPADSGFWRATHPGSTVEGRGRTPLIAAMRLFVASRQPAHEVDIPWRLLDRGDPVVSLKSSVAPQQRAPSPEDQGRLY